MSQKTRFEIGAAVTVNSLNSQFPRWTLHVKPGNRKVGATGTVTGYFRLDEDLIAVSQNDGTKAVYEDSELS